MSYKIVFIDIDGTLLDPEHSIANDTKEAVRWLVEEVKVPVILATARPYYGSYFFRDALGLISPMICFNGGLIMDNEGKVEVDYKVEASVARKVAEIALDHDANLMLLDHHQAYALKHDEWVESEEELTKKKSKAMPFDQVHADWAARGLAGANKLMAIGEPERIAKLEKTLKSVFSDQLVINISHPSYLEITNPSASKQQGVAYLHTKLGIRREEVVAIGDSFNDTDMLRYAGLGIAMGNAHELVKQAADWVTKSNHEHGVALALREVFG